ncbi:MAG: phosphoribosylformylglycinamidine cyclo-ligase [Chlamydiota bacterium]
MDYQSCGVDLSSGAALVKKIQTFAPEIGGFGGLYPWGDHFLVGAADGVGTKLKLAIENNRHDQVGIDLVAMCVNDLITTGAQPLFFMDYYATTQLIVDQAEKVLQGIANGCREAKCVLLGGETAEMPGFYHQGDYDLAGFAVGIVKKKQLIDGKTIALGDLIIGLPSNGLHSNGFSLVRKVLASKCQAPCDLLTPTKIYVREIDQLSTRCTIKGMAHITGGGLIENVPRILPKGLGALLTPSSWDIPAVFQWIQIEGAVTSKEMYRVFNMGIGMAVILSADEAKKIPEYPVIGSIIAGKGVAIQ